VSYGYYVCVGPDKMEALCSQTVLLLQQLGCGRLRSHKAKEWFWKPGGSIIFDPYGSFLLHCVWKERNFQQNTYNTSHHTFSMLPHYLVKVRSSNFDKSWRKWKCNMRWFL